MKKRFTRISRFCLTVVVCCLCVPEITASAPSDKTKGLAITGKYVNGVGQRSLHTDAVQITGKVTDGSDGSSLPGVTIIEKGTTNGTLTDIEGNFSISVPREATLVFSYVGYVSEEVSVSGRTQINVALIPDITELNEVIVIGYGTQKKSDLTGSVTAISEDEFNRGQVTTPEQLLTGKVAGVQITSNSGAPGSGSRIRIRGGSSLNASNDPLIVIDGVPLDNNDITGSASPLTFINPSDIASFNILKDASATAIYGSRASNGVIIITTKKGEAGQGLKVNFSTLASVSSLPGTLDVLQGEQYRQIVNDRYPASADLLGQANTDWQDLIYRDAFTTDNNLSVSGALKSIPFRLSVGYMDQDGILLTSNVKRTSGALSLNPTFLDDHLKVNVNVRAIVTENRFADEGAIGGAAFFDPTQPVYDEGNPYGGYFEYLTGGSLDTQAPRNPLSMLEQNRNTSDVKRSIGNIQLDYKFHFLPELKANFNLGYDVSESEGSTYKPATLASVALKGGERSEYGQSKTNQLMDFYLNYVKDLTGMDSRVDLTAGYSYQKFNTEVPPFPSLSIEGDTLAQAPLPSEYTNVLISYFGRLNYSFKDRYLLTATIRRDGSSRFSPENRWGTFPALALAWKIKEESFLKDSKTISSLKLRLGYGITGQQDIGDDSRSYYPYLPRYAYSDMEAYYQFGDKFYQTLRPAGYDINIKWEETTTYNAGLDFGFLKGRLSGSIDYYFKETEDLLVTIPVPAGSNLTNRLFTNVGKLENKGVEAALNFKALTTENINWDIGLNATYNENEITNLTKVKDETSVGLQVGGIGGGAVGNTIQIHSVGYPAYSFYVYKQVYDENGKPIEILYADMNNDGSLSADDLYRYKSPDPDLYFGLNSQLNYKQWHLGFVLRGSIGNYVYNNPKASAYYNNIDQNRWLLTVPASVVEFGFVSNDESRAFSDYFIENASFLRMDNISLGYDFGALIGDKINLRLTANVQNVFVITDYSGLDPELANGIDNNLYPRPRVYSLGVNLDF